jgi:peptidoglycan/xylan/chitin deacetylase (PgdA/CDA1 family)
VYDHPLTRRALLLGAATGVAALAGGCTANPTGPPQVSSTTPPTLPPRTGTTTPIPAATPRSPSPTRKPPDPSKVKANELGMVPVMMYHRLTSKPGEYDMTPAAFRAQVRRLLHSGYRPINARDLARGRVDVPAGMTPVVLTFDDGSPGQFALRADGRLDPDCAAGILTAECAKVPGAQPRATFYINRAPFGLRSERQQRRSLRALLELGFQLGNHTLDHANLATLPDAGVAEEFVKLQRLVARLAPSADLNTMALPFGVAPRRSRLARTGSWRGTSYAFAITLLVGANPSRSPFDADFNPHAVPRIRGTSWHGGRTPLTGTYWLNHLDAHPHERYVSAGNPGHVTVPKALRTHLAARYRSRLVTY